SNGYQTPISAQHLELFNRTNDGKPDNRVLGVEFDVFENQEFNYIDNKLIIMWLKHNKGMNYQVWIDYSDFLLNVTMAPAYMKRPRKVGYSISFNCYGQSNEMAQALPNSSMQGSSSSDSSSSDDDYDDDMIDLLMVRYILECESLFVDKIPCRTFMLSGKKYIEYVTREGLVVEDELDFGVVQEGIQVDVPTEPDECILCIGILDYVNNVSLL
ncbi:hypothetical protein AQUCO_04700011v1, partial [Aquilegia coerulea]